jgi:hypothetical protein
MAIRPTSGPTRIPALNAWSPGGSICGSAGSAWGRSGSRPTVPSAGRSSRTSTAAERPRSSRAQCYTGLYERHNAATDSPADCRCSGSGALYGEPYPARGERDLGKDAADDRPDLSDRSVGFDGCILPTAGRRPGRLGESAGLEMGTGLGAGRTAEESSMNDLPLDEQSREGIRIAIREAAVLRAVRLATGRVSLRCLEGDHGCRNDGTSCLCRCHDRRTLWS